MVITMKLKWIVLFIAGLCMILFSSQISRYISELFAVVTAGGILSVISGAGLLFEMYGKK